jgi:bifunctional non-homologous end joining protein LigD
MKNISLYYKDSSSDKEYHVQLEKTSNDLFVVNFQYGRVGNALQVGTKTPTPVSLQEAEKIYNKLVKEKTSKGYAEGQKKNDFSNVNPSTTKEVIILPQLLNPIEDVEEFINSDEWVGQQKFDGERRLVISTESGVIGLNKKGTEVPLPNVIIDSLSEVHCVLDGEIVGNKLFVFDMLSINNKDIKHFTTFERLAMLDTLSFELGEAIEIVQTAYSKEEKSALFMELKSTNKEGIVFKKKHSPYKHGRPSSGGDALKKKFQKTATFIVEGTTKGKRSVGLQLLDGDKKVFMGKCTIPPNKEIPKEGQLVEVQYLYAYKGGAIFQPVYIGERTDSDLTDATIKQLVYKAEDDE